MMLKYIFVDDDLVFLKMLQIFFGPSPHHYMSDVRHVPELLKSQMPFDAMISDYNMPHEDGLHAAQRIHALYPCMPIVMLSGHAKPENLPPCIQNWILKPVDMAALEKEIKRAIQKNQSKVKSKKNFENK